MTLRWPIMIVPAAVVFAFFFVVPFAIFISYGFYEARPYGRVGDEITLDNFIAFFSDRLYAAVTLRSLAISLKVMAITVLIAFPTAYFLVRTRSKVVRILIPLIFISSFISVVIRSLGWVIILQSGGPVNQVLQALSIIDAPMRFLNNEGGVVIGIVQFVLPLALLSFVGILQTIPQSYEEAARGLGARPFYVFLRVILPLSAPGVASVAIVIFSLTMSTFTTVVILGGGRVLTLPLLIYQEIIHNVNYPLASAISLLLVAGVFLVNVSFARVTRALTPGMPGVSR
ncbi:MAG: ABC transporter permease [Hyphomicrobiaceae bacterium]|nr:ABC transporter permease [Hyphomicrobiaceae bacterium]